MHFYFIIIIWKK